MWLEMGDLTTASRDLMIGSGWSSVAKDREISVSSLALSSSSSSIGTLSSWTPCTICCLGASSSDMAWEKLMVLVNSPSTRFCAYALTGCGA